MRWSVSQDTDKVREQPGPKGSGSTDTETEVCWLLSVCLKQGPGGCGQDAGFPIGVGWVVRRETVGGNPVWIDVYIQLSPLLPGSIHPSLTPPVLQPLVGSAEHRGHRVSVPTSASCRGSAASPPLERGG